MERDMDGLMEKALSQVKARGQEIERHAGVVWTT
jgi:hypothetical protein